MKLKFNLIGKIAKVTGGAIIVVAAFCIMLPGFIQYVAGLGRLTLWIGLVLLATLLLTFMFAFFGRLKSRKHADQSKELVVFILALSMLPSQAQGAEKSHSTESSYGAPTSMSGRFVVLPAGTTFEGRLDRDIGSSISQSGERFNIVVSAPVLANGTDVLIPAGSEVQGEVVEAVAAGSLPHPKNTPRPTGKLRVQLTGLRTPDGLTYPLVASLVGEVTGNLVEKGGLGKGVGYVGSAASLEGVMQGKPSSSKSNPFGQGQTEPANIPNMSDVTRPGAFSRGVVGRDGTGNGDQGSENQKSVIRSLQRRNHDLFIDKGAPLTMCLNAPFKIGFNPQGLNVPFGKVDSSDSGFGATSAKPASHTDSSAAIEKTGEEQISKPNPGSHF